MFFDNPQLASAWVGMLLPGLAALLVWPVYRLGEELSGWRAGWWAAAWVPLLPALIVFVPQWNQVYPVLTTTAVLAFWNGISRPKPAVTLLSGGLMSISTFLSLTNLIILGPLGVLFLVQGYRRYRTERKSNFRWAVVQAAAFGAGASMVWLAYRLIADVTPLDIWRQALAIHLELERPYWPWLALHLQDFFSFGGWVLAGLFLFGFFGAFRRGQESSLALALGLSLLLLNISGVSRAEVARVWLPYLPLMAVAAAAMLSHMKRPKSAFALVTAALAVNLLAVAGFLRPIDPEMADPPLVPPSEPAQSAIPVNARFDELAYLDGYSLKQATSEDGRDAVEIILNWRVLARSDYVYYVFVHVLTDDGTRVAQSDDIPARQGYPTTCWRPGQRVGDSHLIVLPPDLPPGSYDLQVGMFLLDTGERLSVYREGFPENNFVQLDNVVVISR